MSASGTGPFLATSKMARNGPVPEGDISRFQARAVAKACLRTQKNSAIIAEPVMSHEMG